MFAVGGNGIGWFGTDRLFRRQKRTTDFTAEVIDGGEHAIMYEKPYYQDFQNRLTDFLNS